MAKWLPALILVSALQACSASGTPIDAADAVMDQGAPRETDSAVQDAAPALPSLVVVTFNTGTSLKPPDDEPNKGFHKEQSEICDQWYGNGLSWKPIVEDARLFLESVDPDIIAFQEIFWSGECPDIPGEFHAGFVCEDWSPGDPTVAEIVLGKGWQIMCNPGKSDKCTALNRRIGSFRDCDADFCLEGMTGSKIEGCGNGVRIGRAVIDLAGGGLLTLVSIHGSSGLALDDQECRVKQFDQVFVDLGDGEPGANGEWNLVMGDLNTDPVLMAEYDPSAKRVLDFVGDDKPFHFITAVGEDSAPTYAGIASIDHVVSDVFQGTCWTAGITEGHPAVTETVSFDHHPIVCNIL